MLRPEKRGPGWAASSFIPRLPGLVQAPVVVGHYPYQPALGLLVPQLALASSGNCQAEAGASREGCRAYHENQQHPCHGSVVTTGRPAGRWESHGGDCTGSTGGAGLGLGEAQFVGAEAEVTVCWVGSPPPCTLPDRREGRGQAAPPFVACASCCSHRLQPARAGSLARSRPRTRS